MKKTYITPAIRVMACDTAEMVCNSIMGVDGTASFNTDFPSESTDNALSRRGNFWDDED